MRERPAKGRGGRGDLLYRWGNPRAHRAGTAAEQQLFWPHSAHWIPPGSFFSQRTSSVQRLANGNTLALAGLQGTLFEVTPAGETVWQYVNPLDGVMALAEGRPVPIVRRRGLLMVEQTVPRVQVRAEPSGPRRAGLGAHNRKILDLRPA